MANFSKSFNFRNGLQVDDDKLIVKPNTGLVGIGSTIPTEVLDVKGNIKSSGIVTSPNVVAGTGITVGAGVNQISLDGVTGIITAKNYFGDGSTLTNVVAIATAGFKELSGTLSTSFSVGIGSLNVGGIGITIGKFPDFTLDVLGDMRVTGPSTFTGITTTSDLFANTLSVSDASSFDDVLVSGASTFTGISTNTSLIQANGLEVAGVSTFIDDVLFRGDGIVNFGQPFGNSPRGSYVVFHGGHSTGRNMTWDGGNLVFDNMAKARFGSTIVGGIIPDMEIYWNGTRGIIEHYGGLSILSYNKGDVYIDSGLSVVGVSTLSNLEVTGVSTFIGISTFSEGLIVTSGVSTFNDAIDANAGATLNQLNVTGVSTLTGRVTANEINSNQLKLLHNGTQVLNTIGAGVSVSDTLSVISLNGGASGLSSYSGSLRYGNESGSAPYSTRRSLDLINNDSGNINFYLNANNLSVPVDGSNFIWHKGFNNDRLMTLTNTGRLGIGETQPTTALHVEGISTVTGNSFVAGNFYGKQNLEIGGDAVVTGDLSVTGNFTLNTTLNANVVGNVTGDLTGNVVATGDTSTFFQVGIKTDLDKVLSSASLDVSNGDAVFKNVGIGSTQPDGILDVSGSSSNATKKFILLPKVSAAGTSVLQSDSVEGGALIYNTTLRKLQFYNGDAWETVTSQV